jgi:NitT/TauT family transport system substrate-binding protein
MRISALIFATLLLFSGSAAAQQNPTIRVAITNTLYDAAPILYALHEGMFAKAGLDVQLTRMNSGAVITAAVAGGSLDIGKSSSPAIITAIGKGVPLTLIAPGAMYDAKYPNGELVVASDSPVRSPADLNGKLVSVQSLNDIAQMSAQSWLDQNKGNSAAVKWVEMPMSTSVAAVQEHRIDASLLTSPILDDALATGKFRIIGPTLNGIAPYFLFSVYFTTKEWAAAHPDLVKKFAAVMVQSAAYTNAHHKEMSALLGELMGFSAATIEHMTWPTGGTRLRAEDVQPIIDIGVKYHEIDKRWNAADAIYH